MRWMMLDDPGRELLLGATLPDLKTEGGIMRLPTVLLDGKLGS